MHAHRDRRATSPWAKSRPPRSGRLEKGAGCVGRLVRATSPAFTVLLPGALLQAITTIAGIECGP